VICKDHNPRVDYCPFCKIAELEQQLVIMENMDSKGAAFGREVLAAYQQNQRYREALIGLNAAIDYHWNDRYVGGQRMPDAHAKKIEAAQQVAKKALESGDE
jgi:hypothetical protein